MILHFSWNSSHFLNSQSKINFLSISRLICFRDITFTSRYINSLFCFWVLMSHLTFRTFILFFRFTFWSSNWWIVISCLLMSMTATCISCIIIVNFLWLISVALLIAESHFESHSSCFLVTVISMMIKMFSLSSCLTVITLFSMKLFFILLMFFIIWMMRWLQSEVKLLEHVIISFLIRCVEISCFCDDSCHLARFLCNTSV